MSVHKLAFLYSPEVEALSYPPECPFKTQRAGLTRLRLKSFGLLGDEDRFEIAPRRATLAELKQFHSAPYLHELRQAATGDLTVEGLCIGIATRLDSIIFGIVVNRDAQRFYDEGEDTWPKRYAIWGRLVAQQPGQIAYSIIDAKSIRQFMPSIFPAVEANSIRELAQKFELDPAALGKAVADFNAAVKPGTFDHTQLDDCGTEGLAIPKSHWARAIDKPPFYGYPLRPGITFTYLGVRVNEESRMLLADGKSSGNMFAAGEIMAGNVLGKGYLAGIGMTIGAVFGRLAGQGAASHAQN
ncbi:MAG: FAD-binding protein [Pseudolabrys sp.]